MLLPWSPIPQKGFKKVLQMKRMLCTIDTSIRMCCKTCYKTTKALYFHCTLCGPASGFHKAVSVYHTWLSNNPVVGQTQLYPEGITPGICAGQVSIRPFIPAIPFLPASLSLCSPCITYMLNSSWEYLTWSSSLVSLHPQFLSVYSVIFSSVAWSTLALRPFPLILHFMSTCKSRSTSLNAYLERWCRTVLAWFGNTNIFLQTRSSDRLIKLSIFSEAVFGQGSGLSLACSTALPPLVSVSAASTNPTSNPRRLPLLPLCHLPRCISRPQSHLEREPKCPWVKGVPEELMVSAVWLMGKKRDKIRQMVWTNFITEVTAWRPCCIIWYFSSVTHLAKENDGREQGLTFLWHQSAADFLPAWAAELVEEVWNFERCCVLWKTSIQYAERILDLEEWYSILMHWRVSSGFQTSN